MSDIEILELATQLAIVEAKPSTILEWQEYVLDKDDWEQGLDFRRNKEVENENI